MDRFLHVVRQGCDVLVYTSFQEKWLVVDCGATTPTEVACYLEEKPDSLRSPWDRNVLWPAHIVQDVIAKLRGLVPDEGGWPTTLGKSFSER